MLFALKKSDPAKIDSGEKSGISDSSQIALRCLDRESETDSNCSEEKDRQRRDLAGETIAPQEHDVVGHDGEQEEPKKQVRGIVESPNAPRKKPDYASNDVSDRAKGAPKNVNDRNAQDQPKLHEVGE